MLLTRFLERFGSTDSTEAEDVHRWLSHLEGTAPIAEITARREVTVGGVVVALTRSVPQSSPRLDISVSDGIGIVHARFLGMRDIPGITAGRTLLLTGCFTLSDSTVLTALNPRYELIDAQSD